MRYFIIIYPYLAICAAIGFHAITKKWKNIYKAALLVLVLLWPLFFFSVYTRSHSRVEASRWIYQNLPNGTTILSEDWDDSLPLPIKENFGKNFTQEQLPVFDPDTSEKWQKMNPMLKNGDYYVLSSNRAWGSISNVPERYPQMSKFYANLFAGKLSYKKLKEFSSYPSLNYLSIPIEFPDDMAEEAFTVNDHPKIIIFKNTDKNP